MDQAANVVAEDFREHFVLCRHFGLAPHGSPDHPLRIGDIEIPCYVLDDKRRVLVQRGMMGALDMSQGTARRGDGDRLVRFLATLSARRWVRVAVLVAADVAGLLPLLHAMPELAGRPISIRLGMTNKKTARA